MKELIAIQSELKVPKNLLNKFGGYKYRSLECITEAVKPLLAKYECTLKMTDVLVLSPQLETEVVTVNKQAREIQTHRAYIESTVTITNKDGVSESAVGIARECGLKTGMDSMQLSGATSSYSRKYACNGLFCLDDSKDADATNDHGNNQAVQPQKATQKSEIGKTPTMTVADNEKNMRLNIARKARVLVGLKENHLLKDMEKETKQNFYAKMEEISGSKDISKLSGEELKKAWEKAKDFK